MQKSPNIASKDKLLKDGKKSSKQYQNKAKRSHFSRVKKWLEDRGKVIPKSKFTIEYFLYQNLKSKYLNAKAALDKINAAVTLAKKLNEARTEELKVDRQKHKSLKKELNEAYLKAKLKFE